jgi:MFS transporter, putative metabolite:H+ symporter
MASPTDPAPVAGAVAPSESARAAAALGARMDRLPVTATHRRATLAVGLGLFFDIYEIFLAAVISAVLVERFHLSKAALPPLLASTFVGMFLGALVLGRLADRFGRRGAFLFNLGLYSLFSLVGAFSFAAPMVLVSRFFAGVGVGAEPPLADTYLSDLLPARHRGRYIAIAYTVSFFGVPTVGFLARGLTTGTFLGIAGWRWMFVFGALGAVVVFFLRRGLPESPRWLASRGRVAEAEEIVARLEAEAGPENLPDPGEPPTPVEPGRPRDLFGRVYGRRTAMMIVFHLLQALGYYGFGTLVPLVLAARGYPVADSLLFAALTYLGYPVGAALSLPIVERVERKYLVVASVLGMAALGIAFGYASSMAVALVFGFLYTAVSNLFSNAYHIYQAEIFPTALRSTASGGTYALSRLSTAAMPFVLVPLLDHAGATTLFLVVAAAMVVVAVDVAALGPRTTGRALESVNGT